MAPTVYYSAYHWRSGPVRTSERIDALRAAGVVAIELGSRNTFEVDVVSAVRQAGSPLLLHNYFPAPERPFVFNLASRDVEVRRRSMDLARGAVALSVEIGAPCYAVHAGFVTDPIGFDGISFVIPEAAEEDRAAAQARFAESIVDLACEARAAGVQLLIENNVCPTRLRGRLLLQRTDEFVDLLAALPLGHGVGILLDTGHLMVSARTFGFSPSEFVRALRPHILALHLHDNDTLEDRHRPVAARGTALALASEADAVRWVTLEANCASLDEIVEQLDVVRSTLSSPGIA